MTAIGKVATLWNEQAAEIISDFFEFPAGDMKRPSILYSPATPDDSYGRNAGYPTGASQLRFD